MSSDARKGITTATDSNKTAGQQLEDLGPFASLVATTVELRSRKQEFDEAKQVLRRTAHAYWVSLMALEAAALEEEIAEITYPLVNAMGDPLMSRSITESESISVWAKEEAGLSVDPAGNEVRKPGAQGKQPPRGRGVGNNKAGGGGQIAKNRAAVDRWAAFSTPRHK